MSTLTLPKRVPSRSSLRHLPQPRAGGAWLGSGVFILMHVACLAVFLTGADVLALALCGACYLLQMVGVTAGYHRYFSHRSFKTSRAFQFVLACLGCSAAQRGPLWWTAQHRHHHRTSDTPEDRHSPVAHSFWWSHIGWVLAPDAEALDEGAVRDLSRYPELRWLDRYHWVPPIVLALLCLLIGGWSGLVWGFVVASVLSHHATFTVNSVCHVWGRRRYATTDASRNNVFVALITLGEGWHNNHHHYQSSANQGFFWWELDVSYYLIRLLGCLGLVWDVRKPPRAKVLGEATGRPLPTAGLGHAAAGLAGPGGSVSGRLSRDTPADAPGPTAESRAEGVLWMTPKESIEGVLLETFRDAGGRTGQVELDAPLTVEEIAVFQADQPAPLPDDIRELLRFTGGFTLFGEGIDFKGTYRSEFEPSYSHGIPLSSDGFGNFWIVHIDPSAPWAPILFAGHDPPVLVIQSADLVNFLEEFFNGFRPGYTNALDQVYRVSFDIWRLNRGLRRVVEVRASPDTAVRTFVKDLKDDDYVADLRSRIIGSGFSWARFGPTTVVKRHPSDLLFAITTPGRRGFLSRLFLGS